MKKENLQNAMQYIDDEYLSVAEGYTGQHSSTVMPKHRRRMAFVIAAVLVLAMGTFAYAAGLFTPLDGDDFTMNSKYLGNGLVAVTIENLSKKDLQLQPETKLSQYFGNTEIPASGDVAFSDTLIPAQKTKTITIDLSEAYDISAIEQPLDGDWYYLTLTNNSFLFGYDWMCSVDFSKENRTVEENEPETVAEPIELARNPESGILEGLEEYFDSYVIDPFESYKKVYAYYSKATELLTLEKAKGINIVMGSNPRLFAGKPADDVILDERVPKENQYQLILEHHFSLDAYNIPIGASDMEDCMVLSTCIPQRKADIPTPDGTMIPLIYIVQYDKSDITGENDYAFIRGRLLSFEELEKYKVYDDGKYVCYEVTDLVYTDLDEHIKIMTENRSDVYIDDGVMVRLHNVYDYLRNHDTLESLFYYFE